MSRRLLQAAATLTLVVCVESSGHGWMNTDAETRRGHVGRGSIAAGRAHSVIAMPDGRVMTWGAGARGQLGDGGLDDRSTPITVVDLADIVAVTAGAAHTVALTARGEVFAWGANGSGRLGDGTRKRRSRPVRVNGLSGITMIAAGRAHTLALTASGSVFAWGRNTEGQLGIGSRVASIAPIRIAGLMNIVSIAAGDTHSLAVTADGRLYAWGSNDFSKLGDGTTKDRLKPVAVGLTDVASVAGGATHSLALRKNGDVYAWGQGAQGALGTGNTAAASTPQLISGLKAMAVSAGRHFSAAIRIDGTVVAWGANESGQLGDGTTTRRLRPVMVTGLSAVGALALGDAHALAVTTSGDVRTWGEGGQGRLGSGSIADRATPFEAIADIPDWGALPEDDEPSDTTPPSIAASTSPPLHPGWMTTPVTVTFQCSDDVGVRSCPGPVTVVTDGAAQQVTGTAVDLAGNESSATVVLNLDLSPPVVSIAEPHDHAITSESEVTVSGQAFDLGSGVAELRCNGEPAPVAAETVSCVVPLEAGRNQIILQAVDATGHNSSAAVTVTRAGVPTVLTLTPATRTVEVNEVVTLSLHDESGVRIENASWASDSDILTLSDDDPPRITARALGTATITAEKDSRTAEAVIVVSAGLLPGDARWALPMNFDNSVDVPLFANRVTPDGAALFTVEARTPAGAVVRAVGAAGDLLWRQYVHGIPLMGDSFGGLVVGVVDADQNYRAYVRLGGGTIRPWRYDSIGRLGRPAQAHDGTIYAVEHLFAGLNQYGYEVWDKHAIVIDGATGGLISRTLLTREINNFYSDRDGEPIDLVPPGHCRTELYSYGPEAIDPVAGSDGRGYLVVRRFRQIKHGECFQPINELTDRTIDMGLDLVILSRSAAPQTVGIYSTSCSAAYGTVQLCDFPVHAFQVMPDGLGGTLVTWERGQRMEGGYPVPQKWLTRISADGNAERPVSDEFSLQIIGQAGMAVAYDGGWKAFDVASGSALWSTPPDLVPVAAGPDGGVALLDYNTFDLRVTDGDGNVKNTQPFGLWWSIHNGEDWIGFRDTSLVAVVGAFDDASRFNAMYFATGQQNVRRPGVGIFAKTHLALVSPLSLIRYRHVSIRVVPSNWRDWVAAGIELRGTDKFGNGFFTLGAGSNSTDTNLACSGTLVSAVNREADYLTPPWDPLEQLPASVAQEDALAHALLNRDAAYRDDLPYACWPEDNPGYFNSNSYAHGLLEAVGLPSPRFPDRMPTLFPGWMTPIPRSRFQ